ncbi:SHOCT domain-containing protein [Chryseobacterium sp. c4a]|uniref:SHOCT domain-containing protein n=1 Tax=Chryseobacterium sp. c4a TaxID=1573582 RepID=UPI00135B9EAF|nr:SHOCT domain-containing protein [Chryseobacterium sp. c4a]
MMVNCIGCLVPLKNVSGFFSAIEELADNTYLCNNCGVKTRDILKIMDVFHTGSFQNYSSFQIQELLAKGIRFEKFSDQLEGKYFVHLSQKPAIKKLFNALLDDENIIHASNAVYNNHSGVLLATERRLLFVGADSKISLPEIIDYDEVISVDLIEPVNHIKITTSENIFNFLEVLHEPEKCLAKIEEQIKLFKDKKLTESQPIQNNNEPSLFDILERLGSLRQNGLITDEEFAEQKKKILVQL